MRIEPRSLFIIGVTVASATALGYVAARVMPLDHLFSATQAAIKNTTDITAQPGVHSVAHNTVVQSATAVSDTKYTCPMHPSVVMDQPGNCPICGMTLVKMTQGETTKQSSQVQVSMQTQQRMGVQLKPAAISDMHRPINTFATISPDESRTVSVNSTVDGWIRQWCIQGVGQTVEKGQILYELYSPELQQRQREYIDLLTRRDAMLDKNKGKGMEVTGPNFAMMGSLAKERFRVRDRLLAAGIPPDQLELLEKGRRVQDVMPIRATQNGVVTAISAREGSYINPMQPLLVYTDTTMVWAEVTIFPDQVSWLKNGDEIVFTSELDNTAQLKSRIDLSTLQIDPVSRTARLRLPLSNVGEAFRPGAYAKATIKSGVRRALTVPRDAVIRTGHGEFVVVSEGNDHFRSAPVDIGIGDDHSIEIRSGLTAGTKVAVNGQFLLDAASSLQAMQTRFAPVVAEVRHAGHVESAPVPASVSGQTAAPHVMPIPSAMPLSSQADAHSGHSTHSAHP